MELKKSKDKNRSIFHWIPSIVTVKFPGGKSLIFTWGFYVLILRDRS